MPGAPLNPYLADVFAAWNPHARPVRAGRSARGLRAAVRNPGGVRDAARAGRAAAQRDRPRRSPTSRQRRRRLRRQGLRQHLPRRRAPPPAAPSVGPVNPSAMPISVLSTPSLRGRLGPLATSVPQPGPDPHAFDLVPKMGGSSPAHEVDLRGPTLRNAQDVRQDTYASTIGAVGERNARAADTEYQMAVSQERAARLREAAYQQSLAEQDEEPRRDRTTDQTARQLSRLGQIDHGRFWASRSTGRRSPEHSRSCCPDSPAARA